MALATRCPNCNALFRVAAEQLRSRGGMVRCGSCRQVFNAIAGLDYLDAERLAGEDTGPRRTVPTTSPTGAPPNAPPSAPMATPAPPAGATRPAAPVAPGPQAPISAAATPARLPSSPVDRPAAAGTFVHGGYAAAAAAATPSAGPQGIADESPAAASGAEPPIERRRTRRPDAPPRAAPAEARSEAQRAAAVGYSLAEPVAENSADAGLGPSFDTLFIVPRPDADEDETTAGDAPAADEGLDPPSFLRDEGRAPRRATRVALVAGCALLVPLLLAQLALIVRTPLLVAFPALRPALQALCAPVACTASWPMRPELLAVVSSELQAVPGTDALEMTTVLRNRAAFPLALPAVELTISDSVGHAVARKVFLPADYQATTADAGTDPGAGNIAPGADLAVHVTFSLPGVSAAGFEAYPFYP